MLSASALSGEAIYARENCGRCHTLYGDTREAGIPLPGAAPEGGEGAPGPGVGPPGPGGVASRVGPDLGFEGHRQSDDWQYAHLYAPGALVPGSTMPASRHLFTPGPGGRPVPTRDAVDLVAYLQALGRGRQDVWAAFHSTEPDLPPPPDIDETLRARGAVLYEGQCAACHGAAGDGRGAAAGLLARPPRDFVKEDYRFRSTPAGGPPADADLFRTITLGTGTGSAMPAFYFLPGRDRWALVLFVKEFSPALRGTGLDRRRSAPSRPRPAAEGAPEGGPGLLEEGRALYSDLGCAGCHGDAGTGRTAEEARAAWTDEDGAAVARSADLTHACGLRAGASREAIERSLLFGAGLAMPAYGAALPEGRARSALLAFVVALQDEATSRGTPGRPSPSRSPGR